MRVTVYTEREKSVHAIVDRDAPMSSPKNKGRTTQCALHLPAIAVPLLLYLYINRPPNPSRAKKHQASSCSSTFPLVSIPRKCTAIAAINGTAARI